MVTTQLSSPLTFSPIHYPSTHSPIHQFTPTRRPLPTHCLTHPSPLSPLTQLNLSQPELNSLLHRHPQIASLATTSPAHLSLRINALLSLGLSNSSLHRTILKRPDILTSPHFDLLLNFLHQQSLNLLPAKLERLLLTTHCSLFPGLVAKTNLLLKHGFPREQLARLLNAVDVRKALHERSVGDVEEVILFLRRYGWPEIVLRRPQVLNLDLNRQLIPRVRFFVDLAGGDDESAAVLICKLPAILAYTVGHLCSHLEFWRCVGLSERQVFKIALVYPNIFSISVERKLRFRIEFLKQCGLDVDDIFKFLVKAPLFASLSFEGNIAKKLAFLVKLGYVYRTREMALAVGAATRTSTENMQKVIGLFFSYGFSCEDVMAMSRKHPQVLQYNCESLEKKMEFLINDMEREVGELLNFPAFLGYKLDDRIKYRYEIDIANRGKGWSINNLLSASDETFYLKSKKWVKEGSDCNSDVVKL